MFEQVTIIGFGNIGSSLARGIRTHSLAKVIVACDTNPDYCADIENADLADKVLSDATEAVKGSDLVIFAVPVRTMPVVLSQIVDNLEQGAFLTDTGSVKAQVIADLEPLLEKRRDVRFVPAHPIAGGEKSGPLAGSGEIFGNRWYILTPAKQTSTHALQTMKAFYEGLGAHVEVMDAEHHDRVLAITSHIPHLIAFTIVGTATKMQEDTQKEVITFSAGGFRDSTRMAASDPVMWRDVFLSNKSSVLEILDRFAGDLKQMRDYIENGDGQSLEDIFTKTREIRRQVVDAKQAYDDPAAKS